MSEKKISVDYEKLNNKKTVELYGVLVEKMVSPRQVPEVIVIDLEDNSIVLRFCYSDAGGSHEQLSRVIDEVHKSMDFNVGKSSRRLMEIVIRDVPWKGNRNWRFQDLKNKLDSALNKHKSEIENDEIIQNVIQKYGSALTESIKSIEA